MRPGPLQAGCPFPSAEIEEVAAKDPGAILKEYVDPVAGFQPYQARKLAAGLGLGGLILNWRSPRAASAA